MDGRRAGEGGALAAVNLPQAVSGNTFNADNVMTGFNGTTLTYDGNGNLTSDGTNTYTWDARNHLTGISGAATASFVYDGFGRRMSKTISGTTTQFLYDGLNPVQELNSSNGVVANLLTGLRIDEYFTRTASSTTSTLLADALGSAIGLVTANNGSIATSYTYQPFGATTASGSANGNSYEFTGRENDGTGLYFYRARYYSPTFQRFVSQDPIGFAAGDPNLYSYLRNSPAGLIDPLGLETGAVSLGSSQNPPPFEMPDVTIGLDSPLGGVETNLPFHSGGDPTTVSNGPSVNIPIPWPPGSNAQFTPQFGPGQLGIECKGSTAIWQSWCIYKHS